MRKNISIIGLLLTISFLLIACGDNDEVQNPVNNNQQGTENNTNNNGENDNVNETAESAYSFNSFNLEADIENTEDAIEVDYNKEMNETEASYEDRLQGIQLAGDEAMQELDSIFSGFDFDKDTANEDVLSSVLSAFNVPDDAINVELEIEFTDGTEKTYTQ
ncbi:YusW family protein [Oceanobacillus zhaokaii]|uniref:YusW family protein n=1 Tax=Oceanobacillus zhaokaii TaxID=2052660 RepID=UPI0013B3F0BD|nr:YusW family protein [Oceanobacillus zhaokaii]